MRSYDLGVSPLAAALLGAILGILLGAAVVASLVGSDRRPGGQRTPPEAEAGTHPDLEAIVQNVRSGVVVVGKHDEILTSNAPAAALGVTRGTRVAIAELVELVRAVRRDQELAVVNLELARGRGRPVVQLAVHVVPLAGERVLVVAEDREPALRVHQSTRAFVANATHELKTPIGAIGLLAEACEEASEDPDAVARFAEKIRREAARLETLVGQIITLSRIQGQDPLAAQDSVDVDDAVTRALDHCARLAEGRQVEVTVGGEPDLWVRGDGGQVVTAIANLVENAINYSGPQARVVVTTRAESDGDADAVAIAVSDNGIGISPDDAERVFERFYRADPGRGRGTGGTGLGLSIVREIAHTHGGDVQVWSKPGHGSTFTLRLPAAEPPEEETA